MMPRPKHLFLLFFLFLQVHLSMAQLDQMEFERYTVHHGLSNNAVYAITQDTRGYIWIGTENGLSQFDGTSFKTFYQNREGTGIPGNFVTGLKYFGNNQLGVLTRRGYQVLNTENYASTNYLIRDTGVFYTYLNQASDVVELNNDSYGLLTATGFYVFKKSGQLLFRYDHYKPSDVGMTRMMYGQTIFTPDAQHAALYVLNSELDVYDTRQKKIISNATQVDPTWKNFLVDNKGWLVKKQINQDEYLFIALNSDSAFYYNHRTGQKTVSLLPAQITRDFYWASYIFFLDDSSFAVNCSYGGVYVFHFDRQTGHITSDGVRQLPKVQCNWMFKDRENRLWLGTDNGLLKQRNRSLFIKSWRYDVHANETNAFFNRIFTYGKYIFMARNSWRDGLYVIDAKTMNLVKKVFFYGENSPWNPVFSMQMYHPDTLWISTNAGLLWMKIPDFTYGKVKVPKELEGAPLRLAPAANGKAWMCGVLYSAVAEYDIGKRKFTVYTPETNPKLPNVKPKNLAIDAYGNVWIGGHGLTRWNEHTKKFDRFMSHYPGMNKFEDNILFMKTDERGNLWFQVVGNGLLKYDIQKNSFVNYADGEGIPSDLKCMSDIQDGKVWLGTRFGLMYFDSNTGAVTMFNSKDGIPDDFFTSYELYYDKYANRYLTGFNNYLLEFWGEVKENHRKSNIMVKQIMIKNSDTLYYPKDTLYLDPHQRDLVLSCAIIDFESNIPYHLSYRLDGNDPWNMVGQSSIYLDNLLPGKHVVELKATGQSKNITVKTLTLYIATPIWQRAWFIGLMILLGALCVFLIFRQKLRSARREGKLNQLLAEYEMKALHAQMNPHFIFNCLNSIKALVMYDRNKEASSYINRFSKLVRQNLDHSRKQFITLQQNIEYLRDYLEMENFRFTNFSYTIHIDPNTHPDEVRIAPMLLQPLVENAIWHGLQLNGTNNVLHLRFYGKGNTTVCEIEDNGIGVNRAMKEKKQGGNSLGIENIRQRMKVLNEKYNLDYHLTVTDQSDLDHNMKGTLVTVTFKSF